MVIALYLCCVSSSRSSRDSSTLVSNQSSFSLQVWWYLPKVSRNCVYTDDLAIMHADGDWQAVEEMFSKEMATKVNTSRLGSKKLKLTLKTRSWQYSISTTRKLNVSWKSTTTANPALSFQAQIPWSNVGQDADVSPTTQVSSQKADIMPRTLEPGCWDAGKP